MTLAVHAKVKMLRGKVTSRLSWGRLLRASLGNSELEG